MKDWWRVAFYPPSRGGARKWFEQSIRGFRRDNNTKAILKTGDDVAQWITSFPLAFYPTERDLPAHREEIELFPEFKKA
jgi:hypothetical protein